MIYFTILPDGRPSGPRVGPSSCEPGSCLGKLADFVRLYLRLMSREIPYPEDNFDWENTVYREAKKALMATRVGL